MGFVIPFSLDLDLREAAILALEPDSEYYRSQPLAAQLIALQPFFRIQEARDQQRLAGFR